MEYGVSVSSRFYRLWTAPELVVPMSESTNAEDYSLGILKPAQGPYPRAQPQEK